LSYRFSDVASGGKAPVVEETQFIDDCARRTFAHVEIVSAMAARYGPIGPSADAGKIWPVWAK
jgi:hypothetical protein